MINKEISGVIDFENYNYSSRIFDIAYTIKMTCFKDNKLRLSWVKAFLDSYSEVHALPKNFERDLLPAILFDNCIYFLRLIERGKK
jgi:Ser/Thr protein kinase RdoA (MazF antagonist)